MVKTAGQTAVPPATSVNTFRTSAGLTAPADGTAPNTDDAVRAVHTALGAPCPCPRHEGIQGQRRYSSAHS